MEYTGYTEDIFTDEQFHEIYQMIKSDLTEGQTPNSDKCTIILGGQPGAGKSSFYSMKEDLLNYIAINGDDYRRYHPNFQNIIKTDPEHFAERTQSFSNRMVETLINDLGKSGYNLIIEGTLRNPEVPIRTCVFLSKEGYKPNLVVVACDAEKAWKSTIARARLQKEQGATPRLVPIDIYNSTVNTIPNSLALIESRKCFDDIKIINREGEILYRTGQKGCGTDILKKELNLDNWNKKLPIFEKEFIEEKISILKDTLNKSQNEINKTI